MAKVTVRTETGRLVIDFTYRGVRCREQTALTDSAVNRKRVQAALVKVTAAISARTFVYREFFPGSALVGRFDAADGSAAPAPAPGSPMQALSAAAAAASDAASTTPSFKDFTATWLAEHQIEWRRSHIKVLKCTLDGHLLPHFGDLKSIGQVDFSAGKLMLCRAPDMNRADLRHAFSGATR